MDREWPEAQRSDVPYKHSRLSAVPTHVRRPSLTTNASGIADSCISFNSLVTGESLRLSQFPAPPASLPSEGPDSPWRTSPPASPWSSHDPSPYTTTQPLTVRRNPSDARPALETLIEVNSDGGSSYQSPVSSRPLPYPPIPDSHSDQYTRSPASSALSPYDWHEGSSSIQVDPTEDRMLSTSFITDLLSSTSPDRLGMPPAYRPHDNQSLASSGFSEMTYPPSRPLDKPNLQQQYPDRAPPSAYTPIIQGQYRSGSDALRSLGDPATGDTATHPLGPRGIPTAAGSILTSISEWSSARPLPLGHREPSLADSQTPLRDGAQGDARPVSQLRGPPINSSKQRPWNVKRQRRDSLHSNKTTKSKVSSLISRIADSRPVNWIRKPLPPVPVLPNMSNSQEAEYRKQEGRMPLPDLVDRAGALSYMLSQGRYPHTSMTSHSLSHVHLGKEVTDEELHAGKMDGHEGVRQTGYEQGGGWGHTRARKSQQWGVPGQEDSAPLHSPKFHSHWPKRSKKFWIVASVVVGLLLVAVAVAVGVAVGVHHAPSTPKCTGNMTGSTCELDATCVCTRTLSGQCSLLSQTLVSLTPTLNTLFSTNFTVADISASIWEIQGVPTGKTCKVQAMLVDTGSALDSKTAPNRTQWAQSALLWNLVQSHDLTANAAMQKFVGKAPWSSLKSADGVVEDADGTFALSESGYVFNFANQTVVPAAKTFISNGQPSREQIGRVGEEANIALDRMYTFASAASTQRSGALAYYWTSVLQQDASDLNQFMSAISASPILLPFDATSSPGGQAMSSLLTNTSTDPFPPPLACYPGLNSSSLSRLNTIETTIFGIPSASSNSKFDTTCFANSPVYGVLDVLQLRLPFIDSRTGVGKQAVVVQRDVSPRAVVYNGETLSAMPGATALTPLTEKSTDPREYGTMNNLDHVLLNYLSSISDVNLAIALVQYVMTTPAVPPANTSTLVQNLASIPTLEVAVFGSVLPADVSFVASSFSTPSGKLFFGSDAALALRNWAITAVGASVVWTNDTAAAEVVRDASLDDDLFNEVWNPTFTFLHSDNNAVVTVDNITAAFESINKFSP